MDIQELEKDGLDISICNKIIKVKGEFVGNLYCVERNSIYNNPTLTEREKDELIRRLQSERNLLISK